MLHHDEGFGMHRPLDLGRGWGLVGWDGDGDDDEADAVRRTKRRHGHKP